MAATKRHRRDIDRRISLNPYDNQPDPAHWIARVKQPESPGKNALFSDFEQKVLSAIGADPTQIDQIVTTSGLPVPQVLATLSVLEMRRLTKRVSGTLVRRI